MTLKNNRAPLLSNIKLCASFHHHMWIQTGVTVRKRLSWVLTSVTLTFDLWPWPFAWTFLWSLVITPENFMMIWWWEHSEKGGTDRQTDGQTDNTICKAAWSQLKTYRLKTFADLRRRWRSCVTRIGHTAAADVPVDSCIQLSHLYASVPPVSFWCSWISWSSRNFRQRSWLHCGSYWSFPYLAANCAYFSKLSHIQRHRLISLCITVTWYPTAGGWLWRERCACTLAFVSTVLVQATGLDA